MRAGPLSDPEVAQLLNQYFVPVYVSNEDYGETPQVSAEEVAERTRIFRQGHQLGLSVGTVHVYLLDPDGDLLNSLHVGQAAKTPVLLEALHETIDRLNTPAGQPLLPICSQAPPPETSGDPLAMHLVARVQQPGGAWGGFPSENWLLLPADSQQKLLPPQPVLEGHRWQPDRDVAADLLKYFYPATENNQVTDDRIEHLSLEARVLKIDAGRVLARVEGQLRMRHNFYYRDDGRKVEATILGYIEFDPQAGRIHTLRWVTDQARYGPGTFGVALRSVREGE